MMSIPSDLACRALDAAPDAMIIIDETGIILYTNKQVSALFGYLHDEIVGQSVETLMPERFCSQHIGHRQSYTRNVRPRPMGVGLELLGRKKDGTEFPLEISLSPIETGGSVLVSAAIRDATDRKRIESELIAAREIADRANRAKSRFLATASHDLRQPLQTLAFLSGTLRRSIAHADVADALAQQDQAIGSMSRLINTLLDISKLESGAIKPDPTDFAVAAVFAELRAEFASEASSKGLRLEVDSCQDCVYSDPTLVEQILRNLLANAIKYTREGWVRLRCAHEAALVRIEVLDTGVGIPADQIPYICDEFYQVGVAANTSREGYGLGLSIVQRLVSLLALKLDVRSEVGKGTAFSLTLPAGNGQVAQTHGESARSPAYEPPVGRSRVLLVEDEAAVRRATQMLLDIEGYDVTAVASLTEALQHFRTGHDIDLLITDYHLGSGETGTQVIAALREAMGVSLKAVLTTGDTSSAVNKLTRDPHLRVTSKPIDADKLLALIRALLAV